jgi:hypothetical protein
VPRLCNKARQEPQEALLEEQGANWKESQKHLLFCPYDCGMNWNKKTVGSLDIMKGLRKVSEMAQG